MRCECESLEAAAEIENTTSRYSNFAANRKLFKLGSLMFPTLSFLSFPIVKRLHFIIKLSSKTPNVMDRTHFFKDKGYI